MTSTDYNSDTSADYTSFNDDIDLLYDLNNERDRLNASGLFIHVTTTLMVIGILIVVLFILF